MKFGVKNFFTNGIWEINQKKLPGYLRYLLNATRVVTLAVRGFLDDKIQQKASALTFYSLLSVVPIFAMAFGIAKGFGLENKLREQILSNAEASQQQEVVKWMVNFADTMLANAQGGVIAGIGIAVLLWSVMSILGNIESSFNDIWRVRKPRSVLRKFTDYMAIMILAPILFAASGSITVFISTQVENIADKVEAVSFLANFTQKLLQFAPYGLIWLIFFLVYMIMPNTKVSWKSALMGGIIAGSSFQGFEWVYIKFQVGVARYNAIYGSFAALPLFLIWLQISWNLVLLGCEISFASQNFHRFAFEGSIKNLSIGFRKVLGLHIFTQINEDFKKGIIRSKEEYAENLDMPPRLLASITDELIRFNILVEVESNDSYGLHPSKDTRNLTISEFNNHFENGGVNQFPGIESAALKEIEQKYESFKLKGLEVGSTRIDDLKQLDEELG